MANSFACYCHAANIMQRVCVFCGSSPGARSAYRHAARRLGAALAADGLGVVYGGARVGLMGDVAEAALAGGAEVVGVIPRAMVTREIAHEGLTELRVVASMHERKAVMADLADAFVALPGGLGTLDELFEAVSWAQLGLHRKPVGLLNVAGYFDRLAAFLDHMNAERFVNATHRGLIRMGDTPEAVLAALRQPAPAGVDKWLDRAQDPADGGGT